MNVASKNYGNTYRMTAVCYSAWGPHCQATRSYFFLRKVSFGSTRVERILENLYECPNYVVVLLSGRILIRGNGAKHILNLQHTSCHFNVELSNIVSDSRFWNALTLSYLLKLFQVIFLKKVNLDSTRVVRSAEKKPYRFPNHVVGLLSEGLNTR